MPEIGHITRPKPTRTDPIDLGDGDTLTLVFDANKVTPYWIDSTELAIQANDNLALPKALAEAILEWDVTDEGRPFEPSAQNIARLSFPIQGALFSTITKTGVPGAAEGNASSQPSDGPQPDSGRISSRSEGSPNGGTTSSSPTVSASLSPT